MQRPNCSPWLGCCGRVVLQAAPVDHVVSVYPREVVKEALAVSAAAVVLAHNHPLGSVEPSRAGEFLNQALKTALALVDVRVLDHLVVAGAEVCSFAERGLV